MVFLLVHCLIFYNLYELIVERETPVLELYPKEPQRIKVGESVRFTCRATAGIPYPTLTWSRRDGQPLSSRISEDYPGVITIQQATLDDAGQYECRGENTAGTITITATLEINQTPEITLYPNISTLTVTEGDEINIQCVAAGKPPPQVHFEKHGDARLSGPYSG